MPSKLELAANTLNALSILLAGFNKVHTWWTGILGCLLFGWLFYVARLYADALLQLFFIVTSVIGWRHWLGGKNRQPAPIRHARPVALACWSAAGLMAALSYGWMLHRFTDAYAPFLDSLILAFSVMAQLLLMRRCYEAWWGWLLVNTIAVPLFYARGLQLTALLYAGFWINAIIALVRWRSLVGRA